MYSDKIPKMAKDANNNELDTMLEEPEDEYLLNVEDPNPFLLPIVDPTVQFDDTMMFSCCSNKRWTEVFKRFLPWNKHNCDQINLPVDVRGDLVTGLTVFYENSEKIIHYHLEYDLKNSSLVGRKFIFKTRELESEKCKFEKIKSKFGQENGFSLYIRRISTDGK